MTDLDIEAELSYAYLHAVASKVGVSCESSGRLEDKAGIDASLVARRSNPPPGGYLSEVTLKVQLKATTNEPHDDGSCLSYFLKEPKRYDFLREEAVATPRILVVLFLPGDKADWLRHSEDELALQRCAYWVSLREAPPTTNTSGVTVKLPKSQTFSPENLERLLERLYRLDYPCYQENQ